MQTNVVAKSSLYFSEGSSDKEYHAEILAVEGGNVVNFRYGRRGAALASGTKTSAPVDSDQAKKIFDKLVKEKTAKGYSPDESGTAYQDTENAGLKTDFVPQLLNPISEAEAMLLIADPEWLAQAKMDGERRAAHASTDAVTGMNRKGLAVPLPQPIVVELQQLASAGDIRVDSEQIGDKLYVFDLHVHQGKSLRNNMVFMERMRLAEATLRGCVSIVPVPVAVTTEEKRTLWNNVRELKGEGIVFKRRDCMVKEGRPNSGGDWLKHKFIERASCIVTSHNAGKRSVGISLLPEPCGQITGKEYLDGKLEIVSVGNVTIPPNYGMPDIGNIVDIDYLYAYQGGCLFQPVMRGERNDLYFDACVMGQLKYKPVTDDEAE